MLTDGGSQQTISGDTWQVTLPKTRIHTLEALLNHFDVDRVEWEVDRFVVNKWDVAFTPKEDDTASDGKNITELYQVKAWLKRRPHVTAIKAEIASLKEEAKRSARVILPVKRAPISRGHILELHIPDLHMGKLAWAPETDGANYDVKIAEECFYLAVEALIERTKSYEFEEILFILGNDLLHSDTKTGTTTGGTQLENDGRYQKTFLTTRKMITHVIEHQLRPRAPVRVIVVPGNHDELGAWHMGDSLDCLFANCPDVTVDNSPCPRKYHEFGKVMLMFTHGDKGKRLEYPLVMATERPELFGRTKFREAHTGHYHKLQVEEQHGVKVRISPALCPADAWHSANFFIGQGRSAEAFVWHKTDGLVATAYYTVPDKVKVVAA